MIDILSTCSEVLCAAGYNIQRAPVDTRDILVCEDATTVGFVLSYANASDLIAYWQADVKLVLDRNALALRRASQKAWNTYTVLLAGGPTRIGENAQLAMIEEDLSGTRKIARSAIADAQDVKAALLTLLPLQSAPRLEAVDLPEEIRARTSELNQQSVNAFLSSADDATVLQVMEGAP